MLIVIGLSGHMGSGKTTLAEALKERVLRNGMCGATMLAFADPVKYIAEHEFGWDGKKDARGRRLLQVIGTEAGRAYDPDIWVKKAQMATLGAYYDFAEKSDPSRQKYRCVNCRQPHTIKGNYKVDCCKKPDLIRDVPPFVVIFHDLRFPNELSFWRTEGGMELLSVECQLGLNVFINRESARQTAGGHASETSFPPPDAYDLVIENNFSDVAQFKAAAVTAILTRMIEQKGIVL